jgi:hypothetical protein
MVLYGVISLAVAAASWVGSVSPGDYASFKFPPPSRHHLALIFIAVFHKQPNRTLAELR